MTMAPPRSPKGYRFAGGSKETHGHPIYCVSWSSDLHHTSNSTNNRSLSTRLCRYVATCGGNHVTVYQVPVHPTTTTAKSSKGEEDGVASGAAGLRVGQLYTDADQEELFYACAFGGRGIHRRCLEGIVTQDAHTSDKHGGKTTRKRQRQRQSQTQPQTQAQPQQPETRTTAAEGGRRWTIDVKMQHDYYKQICDLQSYDGPQLLCCAGRRGIVKVIDTTRRALILTLSGHGDEIYDMKFHPLNPWLLLTASKDESLRLWNLSTATCIAIFAGEYGHRDSVLSLDIHPLGHSLVSSGMDNTVKLWSLKDAAMEKAVEESFQEGRRRVRRGVVTVDPSFVPGRKTNSLTDVHSQDLEEQHQDHMQGKKNLSYRTRYEQMPYFSTNKLHADYVDCVKFVGDLIMSKSIANTIVLWKPLETVKKSKTKKEEDDGGNTTATLPEKQTTLASALEASQSTIHPAAAASSSSLIPQRRRWGDKVVVLREFHFSRCDVWFVRFHTDEWCRFLAVGNRTGEVRVWRIGCEEEEEEGVGEGNNAGVGAGLGEGGANDANGASGGGKKKSSGGRRRMRHIANVSHPQCSSTVRMVAFSPSMEEDVDGIRGSGGMASNIVSTCDDGTVWFWEAVR